MKWYQKKWATILFLILFFPVGLFLLWKYSDFKSSAKKGITVLIAILFVFSLFVPKKQEPQPVADVQQKEELKDESVTQIVPTEEITEIVEPEPTEITAPEPNTSEMVDYIVRTAREDAKTATEEQKTEAIQFLKDNYPNYYTDNDMMEKVMYYGSLLEYAYKDIDKTIFDLGQDANQAVKYVYRGAETIEDTATQENLKQIQKSLDEL